MIADQNHSSDVFSRQEDIPNTEKLAQLLETDKQNAEAYKKRVKRLEKDIGSLEDELENLDEYVVEDLDECVNRETVIDLIHKIVPLLIGKKGPGQRRSSNKGAVHKGSAYSSESSEDSGSVEIIERSHGYQVREERAVPYTFAPLAKQRRRARPRKVKRIVV
ncbi:hypothetical protein C1646_802819 [Rhizophagus diaphanus]|nr:hypothetical protein C1646_802819 [Rhizophagus diaphanus] [Rhizophagus sp. MUCL 43196]